MNLGDFVLVNETDSNTDKDTQSVGIVVYVFTEADSNGDPQWWDAVKDRGLCTVTVFRRNGAVYTIDCPKSETYRDDDGRERKRAGTYDPLNADAAAPTPDAPLAAPGPEPVPDAPAVPDALTAFRPPMGTQVDMDGRTWQYTDTGWTAV